MRLLLLLGSSLLWQIQGQYADFKPHDETHTCTHDTHTRPFNRQVRGANLGGWLVLEPWITPSLFYQFLNTQARFGDEAPSHTAMDMYTFCKALGPLANAQLHNHWSSFVTYADIQKAAKYGLNSLRIPVGDWMFQPYAPYIGCTEGALAYLDQVMDWAHQAGLDVLIDVHGHRGSQNGFDNSGMSSRIKWTSRASTLPIGTTTFSHWTQREANWIGTFDSKANNYSSINHDNIAHSLQVIQDIATRYAHHPALLGIEPVNEPWELTPLDTLKQFYWDAYKIVKRIAPHWKFVLHDSFRFGPQYWTGFMAGCPDIALDTHIYQAWNNPGTKEDFFVNACGQKDVISKMEEIMPVIVGEWSLATDNCAMWLNGFNDNLPGFPKVQCDYIPCPPTYLNASFTGLLLDRTRPIQGPYGTGTSGPSFGQCPVSSSSSFDLSDAAMFKQLGAKKLNAFTVGHGFYFWNFKTELDSKWDFFKAVENQWLVLNDPAVIERACVSEDRGEFLCTAKRGVHVWDLQNGLKFACTAIDCSHVNSTYPDIWKRADYVFNAYWQKNRVLGATCDFGGAAHLIASPKPPFVPHKEVVPATSHHWIDGLILLMVLAFIFFLYRKRKRSGYQRLSNL